MVTWPRLGSIPVRGRRDLVLPVTQLQALLVVKGFSLTRQADPKLGEVALIGLLRLDLDVLDLDRKPHPTQASQAIDQFRDASAQDYVISAVVRELMAGLLDDLVADLADGRVVGEVEFDLDGDDGDGGGDFHDQFPVGYCNVRSPALPK